MFFQEKFKKEYQIYTKVLKMKFILRKNLLSKFSKFPVHLSVEQLPTATFLCVSLEAYLEPSRFRI